MSRVRRFFHILASSYAALGMGAVYTLVSVPLALHFLPKAEFGLWAVMTQAISYIALIDAGMTSAVARHLIDHKDRPQDGDYGSIIQTGNLVWAVQGTIMFLVGFLFGPLLARLLAIPIELQHDFIVLIRWQSGITAFSYATRIFSQIIYAHQRIDASNYANMVGFGINLLVLWLAFKEGMGVFSILWSGGAVAVFGVLFQAGICWHYRLFPPRHAWGHPTWKRFKELFNYGKDVFLVTLGMQLTDASQVIIVTRILGLDAAAIWAVCTKLFIFASELIVRIITMAEPMLSEMIVRNERERLRRRFRDVVVLTAGIGALMGVGLAMVNGPFVRIWTSGLIAWSFWNDILLGLWLVVRSVVRCHTVLAFVTKEIAGFKLVVFSQGFTFVALALLATHYGGIPMMLGISVLCALLISGIYGARRTSRYLRASLREIAISWHASVAQLLIILIPVGLIIGWGCQWLPLKPRLITETVILGIAGGWLWLRWGIPSDMRAEALQRLPVSIRSVIAKFLNVQQEL